MLSEEDQQIRAHLTPDGWSMWCETRRRTVDPHDELFGVPMAIALLDVGWERVTARVGETERRCRDAARRMAEARGRRDRRAGVYRRALAATPRDWDAVSKAMADYAEAADRAIAAGIEVQRAERAHSLALHEVEGWMQTGLCAQFVAGMRACRRALAHAHDDAWEEPAPVVLPEPPPYVPPEPRPVPKKRGPFAVLRQTTGAWIVVDDRRPMGDREVFRSMQLREANDEVELRADAEGVPRAAP